MKLISSVFKEGEFIPRKFTCEGADVSPPLAWDDPPPGTRSLALLCEDPDAPMGLWVHWVLWGLAPDARQLPEAVPTDAEVAGGAKQGTSDFGRLGYGGPCPPPGGPHRYYFKLYALGSELDLAPGASRADLLDAMKGQVLAEASLMGRYQR